MSDWLQEIRQLYFNATAATIQRDISRAVAILKSLPTDDERDRAAVYMQGLNEMRREWEGGKRTKGREKKSTRKHGDKKPRASS